MGRIFVNCSNMHSNKWPEDRLAGAMDLIGEGDIINVAIPILNADAAREEVYEKAKSTVEKIMSFGPDIVFCQGEFSVCFRIVELLKEKGIKVVTVCNERVIMTEKGRQYSEFKFIQFREF